MRDKIRVYDSKNNNEQFIDKNLVIKESAQLAKEMIKFAQSYVDYAKSNNLLESEIIKAENEKETIKNKLQILSTEIIDRDNQRKLIYEQMIFAKNYLSNTLDKLDSDTENKSNEKEKLHERAIKLIQLYITLVDKLPKV